VSCTHLCGTVFIKSSACAFGQGMNRSQELRLDCGTGSSAIISLCSSVSRDSSKDFEDYLSIMRHVQNAISRGLSHPVVRDCVFLLSNGELNLPSFLRIHLPSQDNLKCSSSSLMAA
jgi:hypothetical protein